MELKCSKKELAIEILEKIKSAIERLEERTKDIKSVDDFLTSSYGIIKFDLKPLLQSIDNFIDKLHKYIILKFRNNGGNII
jgi:archaellum component FlaC